MAINLEQLREAVGRNAAIRRAQRLQPVGGRGDKIFPPTYPGEGNAPVRHAFETRRIDGKDVLCVLIDSVQSQANRMEEALLGVVRSDAIQLPLLAVDFTGKKASLRIEGSNKDAKVTFGSGTEYDLSEVGEITSLDAPHRVFDAIIRDSELDGRRFDETEIFASLLKAKPQFALPLFEINPTALLFGAWHSTGKGGAIGAKFARCIVSEIVGIGVGVDAQTKQWDGKKVSSRIDPLGIRADARVVGGPADWTIARTKGEKSVRPSEINHSNIRPQVTPGGVTIDYALHTAVVSCAGLRRLRFPGTEDETAARVVLAALALVALAAQDRAGYALRSRCDLVCEGDAPFKIVHPDGSTEDFNIDADSAATLFMDAVAHAKAAGFPWREQPIKLVPQRRLVELVALSRAKALAGESEGESA
jgi:CRISPR-associated protein Csb1